MWVLFHRFKVREHERGLMFRDREFKRVLRPGRHFVWDPLFKVRVDGDWFAGTYGAGVLRFDAHGEWHAFPDLTDGLVINPNAMVASGGQIYAGSLDRGLFIFDRASGRWTSTTMGLPSMNVTALAAGGGYVYVGTDNGLVRIPEGALR